jgi:hypothetical protein
MACGDDLRTQLSRYVDGELSAEERMHVDEHVATCAPCRELLQIFQKNESLLSNALATESFGNAVIESVISEIKKEAPLVEAKAIEEGAFRFRPALALAAAALLVVGLIVVLNESHNRDLKKMDEQIALLSQKMQAQTDAATTIAQDQERLIIGLRSEGAVRGAQERTTTLMTIAPQHVLVRSSFDPKIYGSYDVFRRNEGEANDQFKKMNGDRRLESPEYFDSSVKSGSAYVYKFRAYRAAKPDDFIESIPITMRMARMPEYAAEKSIRVQCIDIGVSHKVAKFQLHRVVNGRPVSEEFVIKPGDRLGELRDVPGFGNVDFRTNLTLDKLEDGNQTMPIRYIRALVDANGKEVIERFKDGTVEVKTIEEDGVLSIRPNLRALFRTAGVSQPDVDLWKGSWMQVRAQE